MIKSNSKSVRVAILALGVAAASAVPAVAQTWQGGGADTLWATGGNWVGGVAPVAGGAAVIPTTAFNSITGTGAAASVSIDSTATYTIGTALTLDAGGSISVAATNGAAHTISLAPTPLGNLGISNASDFLLTLSAAPTPLAGTTLTYTATGAGGITVAGSPVSSTGGVAKSGSGTVTLSGSQNNVTGGFTLNGGTWIGGNGSSFGSRQLTLNGGTVQMNASNPQSQFGNLVSGLPTGIHVTADSTMFYNQTTNQWQVGVTSGVGLLTSANSPKLTVRTGGTAVWTNYLNMTSFAGTLEIADSTVFRQRSSSTVLAARGSTSVAVNLSGTNGVYECFTAPFADALGNTIPSSMGSLTGTATATIRGAGNGSTGTLGTEYSVGALNTSTTYDGKINEGTTSASGQGTGPNAVGAQGFTALKKVGTGTLVLTNATSTYKAGTTISGGVLAVSADGALGAAYDGSLLAFSYTAGVSFTGTPSVSISGGGGTGGIGAIGGSGTSTYLDFSGSVAGTAPGSGYISPPSVTISGATPALAGTVRVKGLLTLDGGTLRTDASFASGRAVFVKSNSTIDTNGNTLTLSGNVNGTGSLTKSGAGKLLIDGVSTLGGATVVSQGTLGGSGSLNASAVTVASGATIAPGNSIGTFSVGSATIGGTFQVEYNGASIDLLNVLGALDISAATVDFDNLGAPPVTPIVFATYGSLAGTFAGVVDLPAGTTIDYAYSGNQIALVAVPEPTSLAVLGAMSMIVLRRRR